MHCHTGQARFAGPWWPPSPPAIRPAAPIAPRRWRPLPWAALSAMDWVPAGDPCACFPPPPVAHACLGPARPCRPATGAALGGPLGLHGPLAGSGPCARLGACTGQGGAGPSNSRCPRRPRRGPGGRADGPWTGREPRGPRAGPRGRCHGRFLLRRTWPGLRGCVGRRRRRCCQVLLCRARRPGGVARSPPSSYYLRVSAAPA